jgi:iron-sulfur cluster assembly protein
MIATCRAGLAPLLLILVDIEIRAKAAEQAPLYKGVAVPTCFIHEVLSMSIQLSEAAAERVSGYLRDKPGSVGLRFGVKRTGCSGWAYVVDITDQIDSADAVFESHGIKVLVNPDSLALVDGTEIDFVKQGLNQSFAFRNPNVTNECGCGESFTVS